MEIIMFCFYVNYLPPPRVESKTHEGRITSTLLVTVWPTWQKLEPLREQRNSGSWQATDWLPFQLHLWVVSS